MGGLSRLWGDRLGFAGTVLACTAAPGSPFPPPRLLSLPSSALHCGRAAPSAAPSTLPPPRTGASRHSPAPFSPHRLLGALDGHGTCREQRRTRTRGQASAPGPPWGSPPRSPRGCARWPTGARSREQAAVHLRPPWRVTGTAERVGRLSPPSHFLAVSENSGNARGLKAAMPGSPSFLSRRCPSLHPGKAGGWSLLDQ